MRPAPIGHLHRRRWLRQRTFVLPILLLLCMSLPHLGQGAFTSDTGWYSAIGVQAWRTGGLWTLQAAPGQPYFNKPPLGMWIHGASLHTLGTTVLAARLPTVLAAALCLGFTVALARELLTRRGAEATGVVLALTYEFFRRTREISLDMWQLAFMVAAVWLIVRGAERGRSKCIAAAGIPLGLALMCKPLVALLVLPAAAVWLCITCRARFIGALLGAGIVAILLAAPWHVSMTLEHGETFTAQYFGDQIADRAAGQIEGLNDQAADPSYYVRLLGATYWPWAIPLVCSTLLLRRPGGPGARGLGLVLIWSVLWLVLLSMFADKRPRYALVLYPLWAMAAGLAVSSFRAPWFRSCGERLANLTLKLAPIVAVVVALLPVQVHRGSDRQWEELFEFLERERIELLWQGGFDGHRGARVYLDRGWWPTPTTSGTTRIAEPPRGGFIAYHGRMDLKPGDNEAVVFSSGDLKVTRLGDGGWRPSSSGRLD